MVFFAVWSDNKAAISADNNKDGFARPLRFFGDVYVQTDQSSQQRESLTKLVVENGWAEVKNQPTGASNDQSGPNAPSLSPT